MTAIIKRNVNTVFDAQVKQPFADWIFSDASRVAEFAAWQIRSDGLPCSTIIGCHVPIGLTIIHLMPVDGYVCSIGVKVRWLDTRHRAPRGQIGNIFRNIRPFLPAVQRY